MHSILNLIKTHSLQCQKLLSPKNVILRRISILEKLKGKPTLLDKTNHKVIYEFKYIVYTSAFLRTKYLLPILSVPLISTCLYLNHHQLSLLLIAASVLQIVLITGVSKLAKNMIGKIYVHKEDKTENVIISYIDSDGRRIDKSFCPDQFHWTEATNMRYFGFLNVRAAHENFKLNILNAYFHDTEALQRIFQGISKATKLKLAQKGKK